MAEDAKPPPPSDDSSSERTDEDASRRRDQGAAVKTPRGLRRTRRKAIQRVDELPKWKVLLHNDDVNFMEDVVEAIIDLTPLDMNQAIERMLEAHMRGVSLLLVTHQERAELYSEQFLSKKLMVTIEPTD